MIPRAHSGLVTGMFPAALGSALSVDVPQAEPRTTKTPKRRPMKERKRRNEKRRQRAGR